MPPRGSVPPVATPHARERAPSRKMSGRIYFLGSSQWDHRRLIHPNRVSCCSEPPAGGPGVLWEAARLGPGVLWETPPGWALGCCGRRHPAGSSSPLHTPPGLSSSLPLPLRLFCVWQ